VFGCGTRLAETRDPVVLLAEADEYLPRSDALLASLVPTQVMHRPAWGHYEVMQDDSVKQAVIRFLTSPD
jgi:hypothetical protein